MKGVDAAHRAKVVLCLSGVELVEREFVGAFNDVQVLQVGGNCDGPAHAAVRAVAPAHAAQSVGQYQAKAHCTAMTSSLKLAAFIKLDGDQAALLHLVSVRRTADGATIIKEQKSPGPRLDILAMRPDRSGIDGHPAFDVYAGHARLSDGQERRGRVVAKFRQHEDILHTAQGFVLLKTLPQARVCWSVQTN